MFASFKCSAGNQSSEQSPLVFNVSQQFSWQSLDLFLGTSIGRSLVWEVDDLVEFVNICSFFMVFEPFVDAQFRATFPPNFFQFLFRQNRFFDVLMALKVTGYRRLARDLARFASREFEEIFDFSDFLSPRSASPFQSLAEEWFLELRQDREDLGCLVHIYFF